MPGEGEAVEGIDSETDPLLENGFEIEGIHAFDADKASTVALDVQVEDGAADKVELALFLGAHSSLSSSSSSSQSLSSNDFLPSSSEAVMEPKMKRATIAIASIWVVSRSFVSQGTSQDFRYSKRLTADYFSRVRRASFPFQ